MLLLHLHLLAAVSVYTVVATDETHAIDSVGSRGSDRTAVAGSHGGCTAESAMTLEMMPDKAQSDGAVCLDGSPGGYYIQMAKNKTNNWQIYFMGGGWCYSKVDCLGRSKTNLGSSLKWPKTFCAGGIMANDPSVNPDFAGYNRVVLAYCDGNSFASNRDDPVNVTTTDAAGKAMTSKIFWRGKRLIDATLTSLVEKHGLRDAETVMLTGASAGGLAAYLHTDYVHEKLQELAPRMQKYRSAPISGYFLDHDNVMGDPVYETMMKNLFVESNATGGLNRHCIAAMAPDEHWKCNFASGAYSYTQAPIFALNSALDAWQTGCIYTATLDPGFPKTTPPGLDEHGNCANAGADFSSAECAKKQRAQCAGPWSKCASSPENCNTTQIAAMNTYISDFVKAMDQTATYGKAGNGAFIHSCHTHCEAQTSGDWTKFAVDGVTIQQAVSKWWHAPEGDPAAKHTYKPCEYKTGTGRRECNPTCGGSS